MLVEDSPQLQLIINQIFLKQPTSFILSFIHSLICFFASLFFTESILIKQRADGLALFAPRLGLQEVYLNKDSWKVSPMLHCAMLCCSGHHHIIESIWLSKKTVSTR